MTDSKRPVAAIVAREADLRGYIVANLFDGSDAGTMAAPLAAHVDSLVEVVMEWLDALPAEPAASGEVDDLLAQLATVGDEHADLCGRAYIRIKALVRRPSVPPASAESADPYPTLEDAIVAVIGTQYSGTGPPTDATHRARAVAVARLAAEYARLGLDGYREASTVCSGHAYGRCGCTCHNAELRASLTEAER